MTQTAPSPAHRIPSLIGATGKLDALVRLAFAMTLPIAVFGSMGCVIYATDGLHSPLAWQHSTAVEFSIVFLFELFAGIATGATFRRQPSRIAAVAWIVHVTILTLLAAVAFRSTAEWLIYTLAGSGLVLGAFLVERLPALSRPKWNDAGRLAARVVCSAAVLTIVLATAAAHYLPLRSQRISHQLCDDIHTGDDFGRVAEKAHVIGMKHRSHANYNEFWVDGWAGRYAACEIWTDQGKIGYKVASTTGMQDF